MYNIQPVRHAFTGMAFAFALLLAGMVAPLTATAAGPIAIPQGPVPVGDLSPVELSFLTIDATISPSDDGVTLGTRTKARIRNPGKGGSFERQLNFTGEPASDVRIGTQNGGLRPADGSGPWTVTLHPEGDAILEGVQRMPVSGPLADLEFNWEALNVWGPSLSAVRLTLHFPEALDSEQLLAIDPAPTQRDTLRLTWSYEKFQPSGKVRVLLIAPGHWRTLRDARRAASNPQATAADYLALAAALQPLTQVEGMPPATATLLNAERLAALRQAVALAPQDPQTHRELAAHLQASAGGDPALLTEAVTEFKAAYDLAPNDPDTATRLLAAVDALLAACQQAGDTRGVLTALDVAEVLKPAVSPERAASYADLIVGLIAADRLPEAEAFIVSGFGQAALDRYSLFRPHFSSITGEVETLSGKRIMRFTLTPAPGMEETAGREAASLVEAMGRACDCEAKQTAADGRIQVDLLISFYNSQRLRSAGQALATALPNDADPAFLLVGAVAGPAKIDSRTDRGVRSDNLVYAETANLVPAQEVLNRRLEQLQAARAEAETASDDPIEAARRRWALALLNRYEADWQKLAGSCQITYRLLPPEDIAAPQWALAWGEERSLAWETTIPRPSRLQPFFLAVMVGLVALTVALFIWQRRRV